MKSILLTWLWVVMLLAASVSGADKQPQWSEASATAFDYRGDLKQGGTAAGGTFDFEFRIYDEPLGGTPLAVVRRRGVTVRDGAFAVELDFGFHAFAARERWLETRVRPAGETELVTLAPRQALAKKAACLVTGDLTVDGRLIAGEGASVTGTYATVGGGHNNTASGDGATVGGGVNNTASDDEATVSGGQYNTASSWAASVGGGMYNEASNFFATVGGGYRNEASGSGAMVPGGDWNEAKGTTSFAAGHRAIVDAGHPGTFVWADSSDFNFGSANPNAFQVRATGGTWFVSAINPSTGAATTGVNLAPGSGSWSSISDRALKENLVTIDGREVLETLETMPMQSWNYISQDPTIRHMGPVAQDFYAAFGLGEDERYIAGIDSDGVALAAIQGLHRLGRERDDAIHALEWENAELERKSAALSQRVAELEQLVERLVNRK